MATISIDIDLDDFETDDLINELEYRDYSVIENDILLNIYEKKVSGENIDGLLRDLIYDHIGRSW